MDSAEKHVMHFKIWIDDPETGQHYVSYGPDEFAPPTNQNTPSQAQATSEKNNTSQDSLERLKYWWGKADKNNRKDFLQWIVEEPSK